MDRESLKEFYEAATVIKHGAQISDGLDLNEISDPLHKTFSLYGEFAKMAESVLGEVAPVAESAIIKTKSMGSYVLSLADPDSEMKSYRISVQPELDGDVRGQYIEDEDIVFEVAYVGMPKKMINHIMSDVGNFEEEEQLAEQSMLFVEDFADALETLGNILEDRV